MSRMLKQKAFIFAELDFTTKNQVYETGIDSKSGDLIIPIKEEIDLVKKSRPRNYRIL